MRIYELIVILSAMNSKQRPFFKGFPSFVAATDELEAHEARRSVYYWWWEFLRLSPVVWFAKETGIKPTDPAIAKVVNAFGDLRGDFFASWWRSTGRSLFAEAKRPAKVSLLELNSLHEHEFDEQKLYLEVPLTIRKQSILKQFKDILSIAHEGRQLDLAAHSQAQFKLHTKRYRLHTLEAEYWVLLYRLLHPKIEVWRIGDRLQVAPHHRVRDSGGTILNKSTHALNSLTGRYLYKARYTLLHAERGDFPNTDAIEISSRSQPFGIKHQKEFRAATQDTEKGEVSAWSKWLNEQYAGILKDEISRRNRVAQQLRMPDGLVRQRIDAFIAGVSDRLT